MSTTSSTSDKELNSSSSENDDYNEDLGMSLPSTITEDQFSNESYAEPSILLFKVHFILQSIRKLIKMIRNFSTLHRYAVKQIKLFLGNLNHQREAKNKKIKFKEFTLDMRIRWCSSFVMILCFVLFSSIVSSLTSNLSEKMNLKRNQYRELEKLSFSSLDWSILKALENILAPLNDSTEVLSYRRRPSLSIGKSVICGLRNSLKVTDNTLSSIENLVKQQLLFNLNFYLNKHVGEEQNQAMLVCIKKSVLKSENEKNI